MACTIWFTGLSGSGKSTCSALVADYLENIGLPVELLDGDEVRKNLSWGLGFSKKHRDANVTRIGYVCDLLTRNDVFVCVAAISPYEAARYSVRSTVGNFIEVYCEASLEVLEKRDVKGLYKLAREGKIKNFTGISDPYEVPEDPEVTIYTDGLTESIEESADKVIDKLVKLGYIKTRR